MAAENHKVVLITGGTGGLGPAVTRAFLKHGAAVVSTYRDETLFKDLQESLKDIGRLDGFLADLSREDVVKTLFGDITRTYQRLDVLVHLIGGFWMGEPLAETPLKRWEGMLNINLQTAFLCGREAFRTMKHNGGGSIFTISSRSALELPAGMGAYSVSKAALLALTEIFAKEGKNDCIRANAILPGIIDTEANRQAMPDGNFEDWVKPEEIAEVLVNLAWQQSAPEGAETVIKL